MSIGRRYATGLGLRVALLALLVAFSAVAVIAFGVLVVAQSTFNHLMIQAGSSAEVAHGMFNHAVLNIFIVAATIAVLVSIVLAAVLSVRFIRPLDEMARAARRIADGDYATRLPRKPPEEIASLADSFNQMAASLEGQERLRREFIVNAAHELRTPLTNLQGYLEALRDGVIAPSSEQFASLHEETDRLVRLSGSLEALADNNGSGLVAVPEEINFSQAIQSAFELARPAFDAKGIGVELRVRDGLRVMASRDQLAQVLGNLLQNASRYTPAGGRVTVNAETRRADVLVTITNSGDGIPAHDLPHVFERFYRVEKSRDRSRGGAGIGLAIVKQLVESAGGQVGADSRDGMTRFWFSLPA